jgi:hypothetical protein
MMTEFSSFSERIVQEPSWRDKLEALSKDPKIKSAMRA